MKLFKTIMLAPTILKLLEYSYEMLLDNTPPETEHRKLEAHKMLTAEIQYILEGINK